MINYPKKIFNSFLWNLIELIFSRGLSFFIQIILARLLSPEDFGLVGMALVFYNFIRLFNDLGLGAALIQKEASSIRQIHFDTFFIGNAFASLILFILIISIIAPVGANFYNEPLVEPILIVLSISVLLNPLKLISIVELTRKLNFKIMSFINVIASITASFIAIILFLLGFGIWSLVMQHLLIMTLGIPLYLYFLEWKPNFDFSFKVFKEIFNFGGFILLTNILFYVTSNFDYLIIGKLCGKELLGVYTLAFILTDTFRNQLTTIINKIMFPVYSQIQQDINKVKDYYLKVLRYNAILIFPIMLIFILFSDVIIINIFGEKWSDAIFPLQMLSIAAIIHTLGATSGTVMRGLGNSKLEFNIYLMKTLFVTIPSISIGVYFWGIDGGAIAIVVHKLATRIISQIYLKRLIDVTERNIFYSIQPSLIGSCILIITYYILILFIDNTNLAIHIIMMIIILVLYFITIYLLIKNEIKKIYENYIKTQYKSI